VDLSKEAAMMVELTCIMRTEEYLKEGAILVLKEVNGNAFYLVKLIDVHREVIKHED